MLRMHHLSAILLVLALLWSSAASRRAMASSSSPNKTLPSSVQEIGIDIARWPQVATPRPFRIIYFTFINPPRWAAILPAQMQDVIDCGLYAQTRSIDLVLSVDQNQTTLMHEIEQKVHDIFSLDKVKALSNGKKIYTIRWIYKNDFEYPGLLQLHTQATADPTSIYLYFHGKGMVFHRKPNGQRIPEEVFLSYYVVQSWRQVQSVFLQHPNVTKIGYTCNDEGALWFNYIWIRGNYLAKYCDPPTIATDRYAYEHYIAKSCVKKDIHGYVPDSRKSCYSLANLIPSADNHTLPKYKEDFTGLEALTLMNNLIGVGMNKHYNGW